MARVLIIDDSTYQRNWVREKLIQERLEVLEAEDGQEGLELMLSEKPDLVLMDLLMPRMSGMDVLVEMKRRKIFLPIIIITADIQETTKQTCLEMGVKDLVNKPLVDDEFLKVLRRVLACEVGA